MVDVRWLKISVFLSFPQRARKTRCGWLVRSGLTLIQFSSCNGSKVITHFKILSLVCLHSYSLLHKINFIEQGKLSLERR